MTGALLLEATVIYLAGPLFTAAERAFNADLAGRLRAAGHGVLVPQEFCAGFDQDSALGGAAKFAAIRQACLNHLARAGRVVAVLDGPDIDSGTAYECGWAAARSIPAVGLRTDWRPAENGTGNCMITAGMPVVVSVEALLAALG